jgi:Na+/glutamate symporter
MDSGREEELKIAEVLMQGSIVLSLLSFAFWSLSTNKGPAVVITEDIVIFCMMVIVFYGFYLALFGENKRKHLALIGERKRR